MLYLKSISYYSSGASSVVCRTVDIDAIAAAEVAGQRRFDLSSLSNALTSYMLHVCMSTVQMKHTQNCDAVSRGGLELFPTEEQIVDNSTVYVMSTLPNKMLDANPPRPQPVSNHLLLKNLNIMCSKCRCYSEWYIGSYNRVCCVLQLLVLSDSEALLQLPSQASEFL
jgi:hypothetical protein